jgi:hypothetical protein
LASVLCLETLHVHVVRRVDRQAHYSLKDAMGADEGVGEVCVLVHLELPAVKRGVPAGVALKTLVVVASIAAVHLAGEVTGSVGVVTNAAEDGGVEGQLGSRTVVW